MRRALFRAVVTGVTTAVTLFAWGIAMYVISLGSDGSVREQMNAWTPIVVGPIIVAYGWLVAGLIRGRWRFWRWMPAAILVAAVAALMVQASAVEAGRAYDPEPVWLSLFCAAPIVTLAVVLAVESPQRPS
jgi:ABC-type uncharacterized transport system permease subunit